jgi:DNA-binding HxlR family transcriptional regulator
MSNQEKEVLVCPVETFLDLVSNKWKVEIIWYLLKGKQRFGELRRKVAGISQKVLTDNLRDMERDGLLTRTVYPEVPPRVEYTLTPLGQTLDDLLDKVSEWGKNYLTERFPDKNIVTCRGTGSKLHKKRILKK